MDKNNGIRNNLINATVGDLDDLACLLESVRTCRYIKPEDMGTIKELFNKIMCNLISAGLYQKTDIIDIGKTLYQLSCTPMQVKHPVKKTNEAIVWIPVTGVVKKTNGNATIFSTPGLVGGWYQHKSRGPQRREDNIRSIPNDAILCQYDPGTGVVGVEARWYAKTDQRDLRDYVNIGRK